MTQLEERVEATATKTGLGSLLPTHYHPLVATTALVAFILGVTSVAIAVGAVMLIPEETGSTDGATTVVTAPSEPAGAEDAQPVVVQPVENERAAVLPELTPKAELPPVPASEVNVSYAPDVPPPSGRTSQAIIDVHFEVVENVAEIDPATGVEYDTWGYRLVGDGADVSIGSIDQEGGDL